MLQRSCLLDRSPTTGIRRRPFSELVSDRRRLSDGLIEVRFVDTAGCIFAVPSPTRRPGANIADRVHFSYRYRKPAHPGAGRGEAVKIVALTASAPRSGRYAGPAVSAC
ncbi:hypothetical protein [Candidatus Accumulibacter cognatus]|uniref:hypothetical protein n=1 Tax=Candidatus Accumulibacter cognatus TaxID=2954383 RepID=UPI0004BA644E|nr:hypothetical protein [Candidatus Accumulibacter cognatus]